MTPRQVVCAAQLACVLEATAPKPGNVSPGRDFADLHYEDFLAAAAAIGEPLSGAGIRPLGTTIRLTIEATRRRTCSNVNLGIVLLLAPLVRGFFETGFDFSGFVISKPEKSNPVSQVLAGTTVEDAREVYAAIRLVAPGGLGKAESQDVADEPDLTLLDVMRLAADRDGIAREYSTGFETTFTVGVPAIERARAEGLDWDDTVVEAYLTMLSASPDTHIIRRGGAALAEDVSRHASAVLDAGGVRSAAGRLAINEMDRALREVRNTANPGTTADLTAAAIFVALLRRRT